MLRIYVIEGHDDLQIWRQLFVDQPSADVFMDNSKTRVRKIARQPSCFTIRKLKKKGKELTNGI